MSKELVISANRHETKVAILEDDQLVEIYFQRANEYSLAGSIHKGRVTRVLPGMQSAFVDLGLDRDTFLYVSDFFEENDEYDPIPAGKEERERRPERERPPQPIEAWVDARVEPPSGEHGPALKPELVESAPQFEVTQAGSPPESERTEGDDRGQRGRRSRRRRGRGRGFPESKYAPEARYGRDANPAAAAASAEPVAVEAAPAEPAESPAGQDFSILPGESLAKYSRSVEPLDEQEIEEIRIAQNAAEPEEPAEISAAEAAVEEPPALPELSEGPPPLPVEALPAVLEQVHESAAEAVAVAVADEETNAEVEAEADAEAAAESGEPVESAVVESVDASSAETGSPQLSANVREQGGRYMHRLTRRMRRKMRSGGPGEDRRTETAAAAPAPIAVVETFAKPENRGPAQRQDKPSLTPSITELLKEGQEIIVQIAKEPLGQKGARITSHIALPGRYVVYMPTLEHMGVSRKVGTDEERLRLKRILNTHRAGVPGGYIVRTAGEGKSEDEIAADMNFLFNLWLDIRQKAEKRPAPILLHHDLDIVQRTLRDQLTDTFKAIWVDNEEVYESVLRFVERFQPALVARVKLYTRSAPIFDAFNITAELEKALRPKVWLKSGGYIVINQTEALVAIDVNTGKYVGKSNRLEDTIVKTNTEAVKEIVRQVRLRDLGGIIVVDFIDMDERKNRQKVMQALEDAMRSDRAPYKILQFNDFGLVAITRKRVKQSLERALCSPCPYCEGAGSVKSVQTVIGEILQEAHKIARAVEDQKDCMLRVHPEVGKVLKSNHNKYLEELEEILRRPVLVRSDPALHHEKFDLA